jgi:hypothetical protein
MFGGMLVPILGWLIWGWRKQGRKTRLRNGIIGAFWILIGLFVVSYFLGLLLVAAPSFIDTTQTLTPATQKLLERAGQFYNLHGSSDPQELIIGSLVNRLKQPGTWITLFGLVVFTWGLLSARQKLDVDEDITESRPTDDRIEETFNLILVLVGIGLTLAPEFIYLLDQFGYRMNTIFKFYYQAWLVWSIAAGFALVVMWNQRGKTGFLVFKIISALLIGIGLIYPVAALLERFERPMEEWTLDGLVAVRTYNPDEMLAIEWLRTAEVGVVAEAIGGQYSDYARIASHTGLPNVLGWPGHESQWGRTAEQLGSRVMDIERLYGSRSWEEAKFILDQYQIRYVYIGDLERAKYQIEESKFENVLRVAFQSGRVIIYEYSSSITSPK